MEAVAHFKEIFALVRKIEFLTGPDRPGNRCLTWPQSQTIRTAHAKSRNHEV